MHDMLADLLIFFFPHVSPQIWKTIQNKDRCYLQATAQNMEPKKSHKRWEAKLQ